jgi:hypothetical protein
VRPALRRGADLGPRPSQPRPLLHNKPLACTNNPLPAPFDVQSPWRKTGG